MSVVLFRSGCAHWGTCTGGATQDPLAPFCIPHWRGRDFSQDWLSRGWKLSAHMESKYVGPVCAPHEFTLCSRRTAKRLFFWNISFSNSLLFWRCFQDPQTPLIWMEKIFHPQHNKKIIFSPFPQLPLFPNPNKDGGQKHGNQTLKRNCLSILKPLKTCFRIVLWQYLIQTK